MTHVPVQIQRSIYPFPHRIQDHQAVSWKDNAIIWGGIGINKRRSIQENSVVYINDVSGEWIEKDTSGDIPPYSRGYDVMVHVVKDKMIVIYTRGSGAYEVVMHSLDMNTWAWTRFHPQGTLFRRWGMSSWVHNGKIYCFGGAYDDHHFNDLHCFGNNDHMSWELTAQEGDIPSPRFRHWTIITGDTVFLFGGKGGERLYYDLHILDMGTLRWKMIHGNRPTSKWFFGLGFGKHNIHNFCPASSSTAALFCPNAIWLLDLQKAGQMQDPSAIWTKVPNPFRRQRHAAVLEPKSLMLWIIGGCIDNTGNSLSDVVKMSFKHSSLKNLAMECVARNIGADDVRLLPKEIPIQLKNEIECHRFRV